MDGIRLWLRHLVTNQCDAFVEILRSCGIDESLCGELADVLSCDHLQRLLAYLFLYACETLAVRVLGQVFEKPGHRRLWALGGALL